jgi:hypothetical protein
MTPDEMAFSAFFEMDGDAVSFNVREIMASINRKRQEFSRLYNR